MVTPHHAVKQLWWTDNRIAAKVDQKFVTSTLRGTDRLRLEQPFGEDLSDETYLSWILGRSRRLFLILSQINCAHRIFALVNDFWQDEDLPVSRYDITRLPLAVEEDDGLNRKFYDAQFHYLLRPITEGSHTDYGANEHIPMEYVFSLPHAVTLQRWSRVHFPDEPNKVYVRRRFELLEDKGDPNWEMQFLEDLQEAKAFRHQHIARIRASYTYIDSGYVLIDHVPLHTLRTFIDHRDPPQFAQLPKARRTSLLLEWMHCLADTIAYLHCLGKAHGAIRPSNILIDGNNHLVFSDVGFLRTFKRDKVSPKLDSRDYTAREMRRPGKPKRWSRTQSNTFSYVSAHTYAASWSQSTMPPLSPLPSPTSPRSYTHSGLPTLSLSDRSPSPPIVPQYPSIQSPKRQISDVWSLGAVYLDLLTFLVYGKSRPLTRFRNKTASISVSREGSIQSTADHVAMTDEGSLDIFLAALCKVAVQRHPAPLAACVERLTGTVRRMLASEPGARPSAAEVREALAASMKHDAGSEDLCCLGREWDMGYRAPDGGLTAAMERRKSEAAEAAAAEEEESEESDGEANDQPESRRVSWASTASESRSRWRLFRDRRGTLTNNP